MNSTTDPKTRIVYDPVCARHASASDEKRFILFSNGNTDKGVHFDSFLTSAPPDSR